MAANVTGANRLLIGIGWSVVILIYWFKHRAVLDLRGHIGPELTFLTVATLLTFVLFFIREVYLLVAGSLVVIYVVYLWIASRRPAEEPDLSGITATLGSRRPFGDGRPLCCFSGTPPASSSLPQNPSCTAWWKPVRAGSR